jgi:hypothetical protein
MPRLPFAVHVAGAAASCAACGRAVRAGGRYVDAQPADGRARAALCLTCARRALLVWSDERRREATAARRLAGELALVPAAAPATAAA